MIDCGVQSPHTSPNSSLSHHRSLSVGNRLTPPPHSPSSSSYNTAPLPTLTAVPRHYQEEAATDGKENLSHVSASREESVAEQQQSAHTKATGGNSKSLKELVPPLNAARLRPLQQQTRTARVREHLLVESVVYHFVVRLV